MANGRTGSRPQSGSGYVGLLLAVAILAGATAATVSSGADWSRRAAEIELLAIGEEFEAALRSYAGLPPGHGVPAAVTRRPRSLDDLLRDPGAPGIRRHLRQIYADPLTGKNEWGTLRDPQGGIVGIFSLAEGRPIRRTGFDQRWARFSDAGRYGDWVFGPAAGREIR